MVSNNSCRDFIAIEDAIRAVDHFLSVVPHDHWEDGLSNWGGDCCLSIAEVAQRVAPVYRKKYGKGPVTIQYLSADEDSGEGSFRCDVDKLKQAGFRWTGNMEDDLAKTLVLCEESRIGGT